MLLNGSEQLSEYFACSTYPARQRGALHLNSLASVNLRMAIEGQVVRKLRDQHMGQQPRSGKATLDRARWRRSLDHAFTPVACELRPHMADDLEAIRDVLQLLGDIFAELAQPAATVGTPVTMKSVADNLAEEMLGQRLASRSRLRFRSRTHSLNSGFTLRLRALQLFQIEFELLQLN